LHYTYRAYCIVVVYVKFKLLSLPATAEQQPHRSWRMDGMVDWVEEAIANFAVFSVIVSSFITIRYIRIVTDLLVIVVVCILCVSESEVPL